MGILKQKRDGGSLTENNHYHNSCVKYSRRKELYAVIERYAECDKELITKMYNNLYDLYFIQTKNNLPRLAQTAGYNRVVEYAEEFSHIEKLLTIAKYLYKRCEEKDETEEFAR